MPFAIPTPPPCLHLPSKFEWFPLWILPKFSAISPFGFSVTTDPPFVLLRIKCSPLKSSAPPVSYKHCHRAPFSTFHEVITPKERVETNLFFFSLGLALLHLWLTEKLPPKFNRNNVCCSSWRFWLHRARSRHVLLDYLKERWLFI